MSGDDFTKVLEPELWSYVDEILRRVPSDVPLATFRTDLELIDGLGSRGAFDALRMYQEALRRYYAGTVFEAIRAVTREPLVRERRRFARVSIDARAWARMFEVPWLSEPSNSECSSGRTK